VKHYSWISFQSSSSFRLRPWFHPFDYQILQWVVSCNSSCDSSRYFVTPSLLNDFSQTLKLRWISQALLLSSIDCLHVCRGPVSYLAVSSIRVAMSSLLSAILGTLRSDLSWDLSAGSSHLIISDNHSLSIHKNKKSNRNWWYDFLLYWL
jgi:hypothetical protein